MLEQYESRGAIPPTGLVILLDANKEVLKDYKYVLIDSYSVVYHVFKTLDAEDSYIYNKMINKNELFINSYPNSCLAIWVGDSKIYMALGYVYDTYPSFVAFDENYTLYDLELQSVINEAGIHDVY